MSQKFWLITLILSLLLTACDNSTGTDDEQVPEVADKVFLGEPLEAEPDCNAETPIDELAEKCKLTGYYFFSSEFNEVEFATRRMTKVSQGLTGTGHLIQKGNKIEVSDEVIDQRDGSIAYRLTIDLLLQENGIDLVSDFRNYKYRYRKVTWDK
jgi:hypothetical protein